MDLKNKERRGLTDGLWQGFLFAFFVVVDGGDFVLIWLYVRFSFFVCLPSSKATGQLRERCKLESERVKKEQIKNGPLPQVEKILVP